MDKISAERLTITFKDAEITDTRLMGALGMRVHWFVEDINGDSLDFHQFIRYDVDLGGIEFMAAASGDDPAALASAVQEYFGSLGGKMVSLTERQCCYLGNYFLESTIKAGHSIPDDIRNVDFFSDRKVNLSGREKTSLFKKICVPIGTDYGVVNYYLMRSLEKDAEALAYLTSKDALPEDLQPIELTKAADLVKNTVEVFSSEDGESTYLCESFVSLGDQGYLILSELAVKDGKVIKAKKTMEQKLSLFESAMIVNRSEYINVFDIISNDKALERDIRRMSGNGMNFEHAAGDLYMTMNDNNRHVEEKVYRISGDIKAMYFFTNADQLLVVGSSEEAVFSAAMGLTSYIAAGCIIETGRYHMETPVFYDFIDSEYDDFDEFLEDMRFV